VHEYLEYFPYGETWVQEKATTGESMPYKFTSKELDPETGLYYFGARYYDARVSRWISPDPILYKYLPKVLNGDQAKNYNLNFPGDDIYNSENLNLYGYGYNNPIVYVDPNGKFVIKVPFSDKYFYFQQKPRDSKGNFKGFRFGLTTEKEGRYIDPTAGGILGLGIIGKQKITFFNDNPTGESTDKKVAFNLATGIERAVRQTGQTININSSVRIAYGPGLHGPNYRQAVDINMINGKRVVDMNNRGNFEEVRILQNALQQQPNIMQNFGSTKMFPVDVGGHWDHVHAAFTNP